VVEAARRGRAVLVEKPIGVDVADARRVADAVLEAGVPNLVGLTYRYAPGVRAFLDAAPSFGALGGRGVFLSGAYLPDSPYHGSGWRAERGAVFDVGPHVLDVLEQALGPAVDVRARGGGAWAEVTMVHEGGAVSGATISCSVAIMPSRTEWELLGDGGSLRCDGRADDRSVIFATLRAELAEAVRTGRPHPCGVARGLELVELVDRVERALAE
jgi:predicted dehydrogenase